VKYQNLVKPDTFIGQYMEYMSNVETPHAYDFWCALWAIGVECGRTVFVDRPSAPVHLNWYLILAAESGTTRKSTAVRSVSQLVASDRGLLTGKTSPEALELILHQSTLQSGRAEAHFACPELVTILGREGYMSTMPGLLTDLYDCPDTRRSPGTLKSGEIIQHDVYVTFLSASTPSWLVTAINPSVIEGGFTSRVIFVVEDARKRAIAWPEYQPRSSIQTGLADVLQRTCSRARSIGALSISTGGLRKFTKWYKNRPVSNDPFYSSFEAREDDHVLRLAACLAINDGTLELQTTHVSVAIKVISHSKQRAAQLFGGNFSTGARVGDAVTRVRELLIEAGGDGIRHNALYRKVNHRLDNTEFKLLMKILHESDLIQVFQVEKGGKIYRATRNIENFGIISEVLAKVNA
tara:strand:+ start:6619 stop:7842 length:1224 start_codon:yes stop_codon:yes gene_type:complete